NTTRERDIQSSKSKAKKTTSLHSMLNTGKRAWEKVAVNTAYYPFRRGRKTPRFGDLIKALDGFRSMMRDVLLSGRRRDAPSACDSPGGKNSSERSRKWFVKDR